MKLASLAHGRDGRLVVVSRDLTRATNAFPVVATLQAALDDWERYAPRLADLAEGLEHGSVPSFRFHEHDCAAPLPRAYQWLAGSGFLNDVARKTSADGAPVDAGARTDPFLQQRGCDANLGPRSPIQAASEEQGIDFGAEIAVVIDDVPMGVSGDAALGHVRLFMLANSVSLRTLIGDQPAAGLGPLHASLPSALSPVAVTPDELGPAWKGGKLSLPLLTQVNGKPFGRPDAGSDMTFDVGILIAQAAKTRRLGAGTIVGSGTVSNRGQDGCPGLSVAKGGLGYACIAEQRMAETIRDGAAVTPFLRFGDSVRIEVKDTAGHSIFGAIEQEILPHGG